MQNDYATDFGFYPRTGWKGLDRRDRGIFEIFCTNLLRSLNA